MKVNLIKAETIAEEDSLPIEQIPSNREIDVKWTGRWPCLCNGEWIITIGGVKVELPEEVRTSEMKTFGTYNSWMFGENWEEIWNNYEDGLEFEPWLQANPWVDRLNLSDDEKHTLYDKIAENDWRHGSCGGCI